jgi:hypothetical protein
LNNTSFLSALWSVSSISGEVCSNGHGGGKRGYYVLGTGKAYQQEPLCVLPGINRLKNASQSCVEEMHPEITN